MTAKSFSLGVELYRASMSMATKMDSSVRVNSSIFCRKWIVSLMKEGMVRTYGCKKASVTLLRFSEMLPFPETIGRPIGSAEFLWIFGRL